MPTLAQLAGIQEAPAGDGVDLREHVRSMAAKYGVRPDLALSIFRQESSSGANSGVSPAGARGPMQLMPATFESVMPGGNIDDPLHNIEAGVRYLKQGQDTLKTSDPRLLAAGYYQGYNRESLKQGRIENTNTDPRFPSVGEYADQVAGRVGGGGGNSLADLVGLEQGAGFLPMPQKSAAAPAPETKAAKRNAFAYVNDFMIDAGNAVAMLGKSGVDLFAPGSDLSQSIDSFIKGGEESQSDWKKASRARLAKGLADAPDEWSKVKTYLKHSLLDDPLGLLAEAAGNIGPFAAMGRAMKVAKIAEPTAEKLMMGLGAMLSAGEVRGNIYDKIQRLTDEELRSVNPEYAQMRDSGVSEKDAKKEFGTRFVQHLPELALTSVAGALGGKYGLEGLAAGLGPKVGRAGRAAIGAIDEGAQGAVEQFATNLGVRRTDPRQALGEDVALNAAVEGLPGGVGGAMTSGHQAPNVAPPPAAGEDPEAQLPPRAAPPGNGGGPGALVSVGPRDVMPAGPGNGGPGGGGPIAPAGPLTGEVLPPDPRLADPGASRTPQTFDNPPQPRPQIAQGAPTEFMDGDQLRLGHWALMEADDVVAGADENMRPDPRHPAPRLTDRATAERVVQGIVRDFDVGRLGGASTGDEGAPVVDGAGRVVNGNMRAIALKRVAQANGAKAQTYFQKLGEHLAQLGFTPEQLRAFRRPMLVRVDPQATPPGPTPEDVRKQEAVSTEVSAPATPPAPAEPQNTPVPAKKPAPPAAAKGRLYVVTADGQRFPVADIADARRRWEQFRDTTNAGASGVGNGVRLEEEDGTPAGRISYNGRFWPPEEAPKPELPAPGASVDDAAHQAATSPNNDLPQPTDGQKEAGNYQKGHVRIAGLDISIENPEGSKRSGTDSNGKPWEVQMQHHYGYIRGTIGRDKDHLDVFVKPGTPEDYDGPVFVVDQTDPRTGRFDEHKVMLGFATEKEARDAYLSNYEKGWQGLGAITPGGVSVQSFKAWLDSGKTKLPASSLVPSKWSDLYEVRKQPNGRYRVAAIKNGNPLSPSYATEEEAIAAAKAYWNTKDFPEPKKPEPADDLDAMFDDVLAEEVAKTKALPEGGVRFRIHLRNGKSPEVEGREIKIGGAGTGYRFAVHRSESAKAGEAPNVPWTVTELYSGMSVGGGESEEAAVKGAKDRIGKLKPESVARAVMSAGKPENPEFRPTDAALASLGTYKGIPVGKPASELTDKEMEAIDESAPQGMDERNLQLSAFQSDRRFDVPLERHPGAVRTDFMAVRDYLRDGTLSERGQQVQSVADLLVDLGFEPTSVKALMTAAGAVRLAMETGKYNDWLHPDNKFVRNAFAKLTGVKLPSGVAATRAVFKGQPFPEVTEQEQKPTPTGWERLEIVPTGFDDGSYMVRDSGSGQGGAHQNFARFRLNENGRPVGVEHFFEHSRDPVRRAIDAWLKERNAGAPAAPAEKPAPRTATAKGKKKAADSWTPMGVNKNGDVVEVSDTGLHSYVRNGIRTVMYQLRPGTFHEDVVTVGPVPVRSAGQAATSAAKNTAAGLNAAIDGLGELFGGKGRLGSGPSFDEDTYARAKPLFQQAIQHFQEAGQDLKEAMRAIVRMVLDRFGPDTAAKMKPYVVRFMEDVRDGKIEAQTEGGPSDERGNVQGNGPKALGPVAPEGGGTPAAGGNPGSDAASGRGGSAGGGAGSGAAGVSSPRGGRGGASGSRAPRAGKGRGDGAVGARGKRGPGEGLSGPDEVEDASPPNIPAANFRITEDVRLGQGGEAEKFRDNLSAIRTLQQIEREQRRPTPDEQRILARYVGWGGLANAFADDKGNFKEGWEKRGRELADLLTPQELKAARRSTRNAHYTSKTVVDAMWDIAHRLGFRGGMALESSAGTGNFLGLVPESMAGATKFVAVEYDALTARIAAALYPQETVLHTGFHKLPLPEDEFDLNIGNPPFGSESLRFQFNPATAGKSIHNQFFIAGMDALRPGGLQILVVSRFLMDAQDSTTRIDLAKKARLVGAIRLPDTAFQENARTEVVTDILVFQKLTAEESAEMRKAFEARNSKPKTDQQRRERDALLSILPAWTDTVSVPDPKGGEPIVVNAYFGRNPSMVLGSLERSGTMRVQNDVTVRLDKGADLAALLNEAAQRLPQDILQQEPSAIERSIERFKTMSDALRIAVAGHEAGSVAIENGALVQVVERETPSGEYELAKRTLSPSSPWSPNLYLDRDGHWYSLEVETDEQGKPVKQQKGGKATKLNVYTRKVYATEAEVPESMRLGESAYTRLRALAELRDLLKRQLTLEAEDAKKADMERNRKALAAAYDAFVAEHGFINDPRNARLVVDMPDGALALALETSYQPKITAERAKTLGEKPRDATAERAPILTRRVVEPYTPPTTAKSPADALVIALSESGRVDLDRIAELLGTDVDQAAEQLQAGESPLVFLDPETKTWETRDGYLSGEVRRKLNAARAAGMERNIKALEAVQPEAWGAENVTAILGSVWVPTDVYQDFIQHLTGEPGSVRFSALTNTFQIATPQNAKAREWGTDDVSLRELLEKRMNSQSVRVTHKDSDGNVHFDKEATAVALVKSKEIESEFQNWVFEDSARRDRLVSIFNDRYNTRVLRQFDGAHLTLPGKVPDQIIRMRRHQTNAIWRGISQRFMLLDHVVGAGKTFTAIARAMERRRMGLSRKPMMAVPNHLVEQFAADVYRLYPGAKVLAATKKDFEKQRRRRLFAKIATGDWDIVVVPHSSFKFIGIAPETEERFLEEELRIAMAAIEEAKEQAEEDGWDGNDYRKPFNVKEAERLAEKIQTRMDKIKARGQDRLLTFEQMGVDDLTVDEAHEFKNLFYSSRLSNVRGMNDKSGSQKAFDLYNKVRVLRESPTGTVTFMTGTPISNSAVEMYTMMRYLAANELRDLGLEHFDAWRAQFVDASTKWEFSENSSLKEVNRLGRTWSNMRSLMELYYSFTDAVSIDDIKRWYREDHGQEFPVPKVKGGGRQSIVVKPTRAQQAVLKEVIDGFAHLDDIDDFNERNAERLRLMDRARKLSLDVRAVNRANPSKEEGGKLERVSDEVARIYRQWDKDRGTQLIFLDRSTPLAKGDDAKVREFDKLRADRDAALAQGDEDAYRELTEKLDAFDAHEIDAMREAMSGGWNAYAQIKANLVARGIPENEIRFIHEANTDAQKQAIFDAMNGGKVRVLLGSTPRLGAGTNVQKRLVALHHVDVGWKPSDIEQREGRIIRQGNALLEKHGPDFEVEILAYATERTMDAKMWDLNSTKLKTINGIRNYKGEFTMDFLDEDTVSMAEIAALASGDPMLLERVKLDSEIEQLELLQRGHRRKVLGARSAREKAERDIAHGPREIEEGRALAKEIRDAMAGAQDAVAARSMTINGKKYSSAFDAMKDATELIAEQRGDNENARWELTINGERVTNKATLESMVANAFGDAEVFEAQIGGQRFIRRGAAAAQLADLATSAVRADARKEEEIGSFMGLPLSLEARGSTRAVLHVRTPSGKLVASSEVESNNAAEEGIGASQVRGALRNLESGIEWRSNYTGRWLQDQIDEAKASLESLRKREKEPFPQADELEQKRNRLREVIAALSGTKNGAAVEKAIATDGWGYLAASALPKEGAMLSRGRRTRPGLTVEQVRDALTALRPGAKKINVVATVADLPQARRDALRSVDLDHVRGLYSPKADEIWLVAENLHSEAEVLFVAMHEGVHRGLRKFFGGQVAAVVRQIHDTNATVRKRAAEYMAKYGISREEATEEVLADMAHRGTAASLNGWDRLIATIRKWLEGVAKRAGVRMVWTDGMVETLVAASQRVGLQEDVSVFDDEVAAQYEELMAENGLPLASRGETDGRDPETAGGAGQADEDLRRTVGGGRPAQGWARATRIRRSDGQPATVYRGASAPLAPWKFAREALGVKSGNPSSGLGTWFSISEADSARFGNPEAFHLDIRNPLVVKVEDLPGFDSIDDAYRWREKQRAAGYDGVIVTAKHLGGPVHIVAFDPEQVIHVREDDDAPLLSRAGPATGQADDAPPSAGRVASEARKRAATMAQRIKDEFDPLNLLPNRADYERRRYLTLGRIAKLDEVAKEIKTLFSKGSEDDLAAAYRYFLTPDADPKMIGNPAIREMAVRTKAMIERVGDALVHHELLSPEAREAHRGRYLPQVYLKFLLDDRAWQQLGAGKKVSDRGYLKNRSFERRVGADGEVHLYDANTGERVDEQFLDAMMGPVRDPGFLASLAIVKPSRDMALLDFLEDIAGESNWVLPESVIDWRGRPVSAHWAKVEAARLRKQSRHQKGAEAQKAREIADELEALGDEALGKIEGGEHADYRQIPDNARYGRLRGMWVRREIYDDLMGVNDFIPAEPGWAQSFLGYGGIGTKITQLWKAGKVGLNLPSQVRNFVSNLVLLQLSGVSLHRIPGRVVQAWREITTDGPHWRIAKRYGVTESTFQAQELYRMKRDLLEIEQRMGALKTWGRIKLLMAALSDYAADKYQFVEALGKTVKIIDEMAKGKTEAEAAMEAQHWLFDYSLVSKNVRYLRNAPLGMPFVTFAVKVAPRLLEVARTHPERFAPWVALAYGLPALVAGMFDVDGEDIEKLKKAMPEWLQDRGHAYVLPWKDDSGRWQAIDMGYFFPWTTWTEPIRDLASGEPGKAVQAAGLFGGPLADIITAFATGRDAFTGREIVAPGDPPDRQLLSMVNYAWSMAMPPMFTDYGTAGKAIRAWSDTTNRFGDPLSTAAQTALSAVGVNLYPIRPETQRAQNVKQMWREVRDAEYRLRQRLGDRSLTNEERADLIREYAAEVRRRQEKVLKYLSESAIHPNLATDREEEATE